MIYLALHAILLFWTTYLLGSCVPQLIIFFSNQGVLGCHGQRFPLLRTKRFTDWTDIEQQYVLTRLFKDFMLVVLFIVQHSCMATQSWKQFLLGFNIFVSNRLLFNIASCLTLKVLMNEWKSTPDVVLWALETDQRPALWWFFFLLHTLCWLMLFSELSVMNPLEFIGFQQVYNYYNRRQDPLCYMPKHLQIFYLHLRHAGLTCVWVMLWVHPYMTLDRLMLAAIFSLYLALGSYVSLADFKFVYSYFYLKETVTRYEASPSKVRVSSVSKAKVYD